MTDRWANTQLGAMATKIGSGATPRGGRRVYKSKGTTFIRSQNVLDNHFNRSGLVLLDEAAAQALSTVSVEAGDVLLNITGDSVARCCVVPPSVLPARVSQHVIIVRPDPRQLNSRFLQACLVEPVMKYHLLALAAAGATRPALTKSQVAGLEVPIPPLRDQEAIAEVLGALDDKIECNKQIRRLCSQSLRASFTRVARPGLTAVAARLPLPADWTGGVLGDWLDVLETGSRPRGGVAKYANGIPSLGAESVLGLAEFDYSKTKYVPEEFFVSMKRGVAEDQDVLLYKDGGRPGEFEPHVALLGEGFPFLEFCINEHVYRLRGRVPLTQEYLFCWLTSEPLLEEMRQRGTGVAIPGLNSPAVKALPLGVPPRSDVILFSATATAFVRRALNASAESHLLAQLRDVLLPRLLSGELRVRDAGALVAGAV